MLVEKFVAVISAVSDIEVEGEVYQALDTIESDPVETYEEAITYIKDHHETYGDAFHHGQVKKVFIRA